MKGVSKIFLTVNGVKSEFVPKIPPVVEPPLPPQQVDRLPVVPYTLGIITQKNEATFMWEVQACQLMDYPKGTIKGHTYRISDAWVNYMRKIMVTRAWQWWIEYEYMLMINRPSKWGSGLPTDEPMFENIGLPNNFVAMDLITNTHARVVGKSSTNFDTSKLNPEVDNWFHKPTEYWMASTQNRETSEVGMVADGTYHVYTPVIRQFPDQWILTNRVEMFPNLPMDVTYLGKKYTITGYALQGASVYGHAEEMDVPLRLSRKRGELIHPCPEWKLYTRPLIHDPRYTSVVKI